MFVDIQFAILHVGTLRKFNCFERSVNLLVKHQTKLTVSDLTANMNRN